MSFRCQRYLNLILHSGEYPSVLGVRNNGDGYFTQKVRQQANLTVQVSGHKDLDQEKVETRECGIPKSSSDHLTSSHKKAQANHQLSSKLISMKCAHKAFYKFIFKTSILSLHTRMKKFVQIY